MNLSVVVRSPLKAIGTAMGGPFEFDCAPVWAPDCAPDCVPDVPDICGVLVVPVGEWSPNFPPCICPDGPAGGFAPVGDPDLDPDVLLTCVVLILIGCLLPELASVLSFSANSIPRFGDVCAV